MGKEDTPFNIIIKNKVAILFYIKLFFYFIIYNLNHIFLNLYIFITKPK